jgi:hypothetical protein
MSISPILSKPIDMIGSIIIEAGVADKNEVSALKAVSGYAKRNGLLGSIATLLHRVWNAFKAVFGQSDWDMAHRAFTSIANRHLSNQLGIQTIFLDESLHFANEVNDRLNQFVELMNATNQRVQPLGIHAESVINRFEVELNGDKEKIIANLRENFLETITLEISQDNQDSIYNKLLRTIQEVETDVFPVLS